MRALAAWRDRWRAMERERRDLVVLAVTALLALAILGGFVTREDVQWRQMTGFLLAITVYAIFALGLSLQFGYTGLLNLGHAGFMAIGAYTYGILMWTGGRPDNPAPIVGWLADRTPALEGATAWGLAACALVALVAGALVAIPVLLALESAVRPESRRRPARRAIVGAVLAAAGALVAWGAFRARGDVVAALDALPTRLVSGVVILVLFAGVLACVAGVVLLARGLLALVAGAGPFARPRARLLLAGGLALAVAVGVFLASYPLDPEAAIAVGVVISILVGMALAALVALLLGLPAIRLREDYLAIVTLGAAEILRAVIVNEERWTRGTQPIQQYPRPLSTWASDTEWWGDVAEIFGARAGDLALLAVAIGVLAYVYVLLAALSRSPWGRVLKGIREDEDATASLGKRVTWFKLQSLMLGSAIAAVAGVIFVTEAGLVTALQFPPVVTFYAFIIVVLGGIGNHRGAIAGAIILWTIFFGAQNAGLEAFGVEAGPQQIIFVGVVLIVVMMLRPQGIIGRKEELLFAK